MYTFQKVILYILVFLNVWNAQGKTLQTILRGILSNG